MSVASRQNTERVGPRGQEFKEHAFEWLKPLATTERPKGESRTTLQGSVQFTTLPEEAFASADGAATVAAQILELAK
jgi:hypothetical protein